MYKIETNPTQKLLHLILTGYWDITTVNNFERDIDIALQRQGWRSGNFVVLVDLRDHGVQSQDVATRARSHFRSG